MSTVEAVDPRTGQALKSYPAASSANLERAVTAAAEAARDPRLADPAARAALLEGIAAGLEAQADAIIALAGQETGLPAPRLTGELGRTCGQLRQFAAYITSGEHHGAIIDRADPDAKPIPKPDLRRVLVPIGPVAVFGASNFPLAFSTAGGDTAAALAAGCPVVVKGHPSHPGTGTLVAEIIARAVADADLPAGTFGHVLGGDHALGEALVDHPLIEAVAFTGSFRGGAALVQRAAARDKPIPVFAEMGSLNPVVATADALGPDLVTLLAGAVGTFGGQLCTKPGIVFVPSGEVGDRFAQDLAAALGEREPEVLLNRPVRDGFVEGLKGLEDAPGVTRLTPAAPGQDAEGFRHAPAVYAAHARDLGEVAALSEEHFGPAVVVAAYDGLDDVPALLDDLGGQLTVTVHASEDEAATLEPVLAAATRNAGRVLWGGVPTGVAVTAAMQHGGPWPATSAPATTSVGLTAIERFLRPVVHQSTPPALLPPALQDANPLRIPRRVDGVLTRDPL